MAATAAARLVGVSSGGRSEGVITGDGDVSPSTGWGVDTLSPTGAGVPGEVPGVDVTGLA